MSDEAKKQIIQKISEFSDTYLDDEFKALSIKLADRLAENITFKDKQIGDWAGGIVYAICQLNFLFDDIFKYYITREEICYYFSTTRTKMYAKSRDIRRLLNLKLGNEEFSCEFVLSLNIPEDDIDLKRIRLFDEVKRSFRQKRPDSPEMLKNKKLEELIKKNSDELYLLLMSSYVLIPHKDFMQLIIEKDDKYINPVFTSLEKCEFIKEEFDDVEFRVWPFFNIAEEMESKKFGGVLINYGSDNILLTRDMIDEIYPNRDKIDYYNVFRNY